MYFPELLSLKGLLLRVPRQTNVSLTDHTSRKLLGEFFEKGERVFLDATGNIRGIRDLNAKGAVPPHRKASILPNFHASSEAKGFSVEIKVTFVQANYAEHLSLAEVGRDLISRFLEPKEPILCFT